MYTTIGIRVRMIVNGIIIKMEINVLKEIFLVEFSEFKTHTYMYIFKKRMTNIVRKHITEQKKYKLSILSFSFTY